jgi:hypothetical protein
MTDSTGHLNRSGIATTSASTMTIEGIPLNHYILENSVTGRVEIIKPLPPGTEDRLVKDFTSATEAWAWATAEFHAGRMP